MALNFNVAPYNDDFDPNKNFHRILFKPGAAVQARELTQAQTILQNQISNFASSIFSQNTPVSGGNVTTNLSCNYIKLNQTYNNAPIAASNFLNKIITDSTGTVLARVIATSETTSPGTTAGDPPTLIVTYISGTYFSDNMQIFTTDGTNFTATTIGVTGGNTSVGLSSVASISPGIFYVVNGYNMSSVANQDGTFNKYSIGNFVSVLQQTIILNKYNNTPSLRVGLQIHETIVDYINDSSLLDPATGASNYQAPGADRYSLSLELLSYPLDLGNDDLFIELLRMNNGSIIKQVDSTVYSTIDDYFAKRDFETNGDYIVTPFTFTPTTNSGKDSTKYDLSISKGIAYVHGYRIENQSNLVLTSNRARTTTTVGTNVITTPYENYLYVDTLSGFFDVTAQPFVDIHCVPASSILTSGSSAAYNSTVIGTANIRNLAYVSDNGSANVSSYVYKAYLSNISTFNLSGNTQSATANTITINDSLNSFSTSNNAYYNMQLTLTGGLSAGDVRNVIAYNGSTKTLTVSSPFTVNPNSTTTFTLNTQILDAESIVQVNGSYALTANANINIASGKLGSTTLGDTQLFGSSTPELIFPLGNPYVKTTANSSYTSTKNWRTKTFSSGTGVLTLTLNPPFNFIGSGTLTPSTIKPNYTIIDSTTKQILDICTSGTVVISPDKSQITFTNSAHQGKSVNVITNISVQNSETSGYGVLKSKQLIVGSNTTISTSGPSSGGALNGTTYIDLPNGQVYILNSALSKSKISLYVSDVKRITKIIDTKSPAVSPTTAMLTSSSNDITNLFFLDNGQRDTFYDFASISLIPGASIPSGNILVIYDKYSHFGGDGYFNVLSYLSSSLGGISTSPESYQNIPTYISQSGNSYRLADCLDFRPVRLSAQTTFAYEFNTAIASDGGTLIPASSTTGNFTGSYSYYLPRKDLLVLSKDKNFQIIEGTPSTFPILPSAPNGALILANLSLDPFTAYVPGENPPGISSNLSIDTIPHNRWAKSDITDLQTRVNNLEYYTSLSVLEQNAQSLQVADVNGLNRFKNGILVDDFSSYYTADTANKDFASNINIRTKRLSPITLVDNFQLQNPIVLNGLGTIKQTNTFAVASLNGTKSNLFTLPYTSNTIVSQPLASGIVSLNPFAVTIYQGNAYLYPPMDNWVDTVQSPAILSNSPVLQISQQTNGVNIINAGDFAIIPGTSASVSTSKNITNHGAFNGPFGTSVGYTATTTSTYASTLQNISTTIPSSPALNVNNGYLNNIAILPYIRPQQIGFKVEGLLVNTPVSTWFDGINVDQYITSPNTIELTGVSGKFSTGDVVGFYVSNSFYPTARVESVYVYPTGNVRLYVSNVIGAPSYTTTNIIQNALFDSSGNYVSSSASGTTNSAATPLSTHGQITAVGGGKYSLKSNTASIGTIYGVQDPNKWCSFMNQHAVWGDLKHTSSYSATYVVNVPAVATYNYEVSSSGAAVVTFNGGTPYTYTSGAATTSTIINSGTPYTVTSVSGNNTIKINVTSSPTGSPSGVALVVKDSSGNIVFSSRHPTGLNYANTSTELVMPQGGAWFTGVTAIALDENASNIPNFYTGAKINITSNYVYQYTLQTATYIPPSTGPSGGGGGSGSIICTKLFELGLLDSKIYEADEAFGKMVREQNPKVYEGYIRWASIVVDWMNGSGPDIMFWIKDAELRKKKQQEMVTKWTHRIATPWAEHMAYKMGAIEKDNKVGKFIMAVGFPICKVANLLINNRKPNLLIGYSMWALFSILYSISTFFKKEIKSSVEM